MTGKERKTKVYHADLWSLRERKYAWLEENDWTTTGWQKIQARSEFYLFVPRDEETLERYNRFVKITGIFPVNSVGIVTSRDRFVFDFDRETLKRRIRTFLDPNLPDEIVRETFGLKDSQAWNLIEARQAIQQDEDWKKKTIQCLYRPFDVRWLFYHPAAIERGREEVMRYMLRDNLALITPRQHKDEFGAYITKHVGTHKTVAAYDINYYYPLHLYPSISKENLFSDRKEVGERRPNLNSKVVQTLKTAYGQEPAPEEIFNYVYAVLYASSYREKYAEFLRIDFPRIPFTRDFVLFQKLAALGERLVDLHLLRSAELDPPIARFQGEGDNKVQTGKKGLRYEPDTQRVFINGEQYFEGVPAEVWEYMIGGYQVCRKWLKDRRDRSLALEEIKTCCRIVTALAKTIEAQSIIGKLYPKVEENLLSIELTDG